jgi:hypothetical protein
LHSASFTQLVTPRECLDLSKLLDNPIVKTAEVAVSLLHNTSVFSENLKTLGSKYDRIVAPRAYYYINLCPDLEARDYTTNRRDFDTLYDAYRELDLA